MSNLKDLGDSVSSVYGWCSLFNPSFPSAKQDEIELRLAAQILLSKFRNSS